MPVPSTARRRVALLFGGRSSEHEISCISAGNVLAAIDRERFEVVPVGITREGRWVLAPDDPQRLRPVDGRLPEVDPAGTPVTLSADPTQPSLLPVNRDGGAAIPVDVAFPLLHGPYGEDGTVQGLLELAGVPYVGSGVLASALAMDKEFMKLTLAARGLPVGAWQAVRHGEWRQRPDAVTARLADLGLPVFVKPARGGSSIGITRVQDHEALGPALDLAFRHDGKAVVEAAIAGREVECGVLAAAAGGEPQASPPAEIRVPTGRFYDFAAKYLEDTTRFEVPADLPSAVTEQVRASAVRAFTGLGCAGLARVDFFVRDGGEVVVNEVNTMPGFTAASMFPRMWAAAGVGYPELVARLLDAAGRDGGQR